MMSPTQAMFWQIWRGWRWGLLAGLAYMLVAAVVAQVLPDYLRRTPGGEFFLPNAAAQLALPCAFLVIHLAAAFSLTGGDLKERGYWRTMFVLPVRTRSLVAWPMLWGCLALAGIWLFVALLIVRPMGHTVPLVRPMAAAAAGLTLLQALSWVPLEQAWLRAVIAVPLMAIVGIGAALAAVFHVPEPIAAAAFLALLPLTYAAALRGVAAARRGDAFDWRLWNRVLSWAAKWRRPAEHPFRSAEQAQFWFECRSHAWFLPLFTTLILALMLLLPLIDGAKNAQLPWKLLPMVLLMPILMATMMGPQVGNASFPFLATRPVSTAAIVKSKIQMALASVLVAYVPVLIAVLLLFTWPGFLDSALQAAHGAGAAKSAAVVLLAAVVPVLLTWKAIVESLWLGLFGRDWLVNAFAFGFAALLGCAVLFGLWLMFHPELKARLWSLVPWFVGLLVIVKSLVAAWMLYVLVRGRLFSLATAGLMIGGWGCIALGLSLIVLWLLPAGMLSPRLAVAGVILFTPLSRIAGAPLALDSNRHR